MSIFDESKEDIYKKIDNLEKRTDVVKTDTKNSNRDTQIEQKKKELKELEEQGKFKKGVSEKRRYKIRFGGRHRNTGSLDTNLDYVPPSVVELEHRVDWSRISMWLAVFGIIAIVMISQSTYSNNAGVLIILLFFGMGCFLPLGLVIGWLFLNIDMRCKMMRLLRHKNYGIVHFVLRGGRNLVTRIMDLNGDVVVNEMRMWVIDKKGVHYIDRDGKKQFWAEITSDNIKTLPANIPTLYLDYETMIPLKFYKEQSDSNPQQVGATHLGYIANQIAKMLFFKKTMTFFYIIMVVITALTLVIVLQEAMWLNEMNESIPKLNQKIDDMFIKINSITNNATGLPNGNNSYLPPPPPGD